MQKTRAQSVKYYLKQCRGQKPGCNVSRSEQPIWEWPILDTDAKKMVSNQADIQAVLSKKELVILTKFHNDWQKSVLF